MIPGERSQLRRPARPVLVREAAVKIGHVEAWTVPYSEPNDHGSIRYVSLCRVEDSDGAIGWGEAVSIQEEAARATTVVLRHWAPLLTGVIAAPNPVRTVIERRGWWYGEGGGISGFALSALDTALWDLLARRAGRPLVEILGGAVHGSGLPVIVTTHAMLADLDEQAAALAGWCGDMRAAGVKVGFGKPGDAFLGFEHSRDVAFVAALRSAVGDSAKIMIDLSPLVRWSVSDAITRVRAFEDYGLHWVEEPLGADDPEGYVRLANATSCLLAYGEREWTLRGMARILDSGTLDVLGIDTGRAGGVSNFVAAASYAQARRRQVNAHAFAGPVSYAAGLACSLATANCLQFEVAPLRNSLMTTLAPDLPLPIDGRVLPLPGDGLGVDIDREAVVALSDG